MIGICKICGKEFNKRRKTSKYCSVDCQHKGQIKHDYSPRICPICGNKNGKPDLSITLTKLYMRDNGICSLCGKHIDFDCDSNSNDYPSIDHIIPIAKGGTHTWDNVQLACRYCNTLKSDRTA